MSTYKEKTLIEIDRDIALPPFLIILDGTTLHVRDIIAVAHQKIPIEFTDNPIVLKRVEESYQRMMQNVIDGVPVYGCNTGYGARAGHVVNEGEASDRILFAQKISKSIVHTDVTVGPILPKEVVRAAMVIRMNMLLHGVSAVKLSDLDIFRQMLNKDIIPVVNAYGGLGASGDLAHNSRVVSAARQLDGVFVWDADGQKKPARTTLKHHKIPKLELDPKAGLGLVNGDNFSTAAATLIAVDVLRLQLIADVLGAMMVEVLRGSTRPFHPFLGNVRPHRGQQEVAKVYRYLLHGSKLAYQELQGQQERPKGVSVQDAYSLRCLPQSEAVNREFLAWALETITINANSVSDNPLWVTPEHAVDGEEPWQWVSGGNFFAMHMGEVIDIMRKIITRLIKRNDRQLHRLLNPHLNNGLPANLSDSSAISQCAFKGVQLQSGMFDVYSMLLANPVTTMFGIHEEHNQDITPHSLTSALFAWEGLRVLRYSLAMNAIAIAQAVDLREGVSLLSPRTRPMYEYIRSIVSYVKEERPLNQDIERIYQEIESGKINEMLRKAVFNEFGKYDE